MSPFIFAVLLVAIWWFLHLRRTATLSRNHPKGGRKLPPGPQGLPIIGNRHMLGNLPYRTLHELSKNYGPIMSLRLGYVPTIVVSSPQAAELFLKTHDSVFANRPNLQIGKYLFYGGRGMAFTPYGTYWRNVRKFCTLELFSTKKIDSLAGMRREELGMFVKSLKEAAVAREVVDVGEKVAGLIEKVTYMMLLGKNKNDMYHNLKASVMESMRLAGAFNLADYVPFLGAFDLQVNEYSSIKDGPLYSWEKLSLGSFFLCLGGLWLVTFTILRAPIAAAQFCKFYTCWR